MRILRRSSIRTKLKLAILSTTFLSVAFVFVGLFVYERVNYDRMFARDLSAKADIIAQNSDAALVFRNSTDATRVLSSLSTQDQIVTAAIYDQEGNIFAEYRRDEGGVVPPMPAREGYWYGEDGLTLTRPVRLNEDRIGTIYVTADLREKEEHFRSYMEIAALVLLGALAVGFVVATVLEQNISRPILNLAGTAKLVSEQRDYSLRAVRISGDETGLLADAINQMLAQIQERDDNLRRTNEALVEEIAERRRAEDSLRAAETQLRLITDTTPLMLTRHNREKQFVYVNRAYAEMVDLPSEEIIGRHITEIIGDEGYQTLAGYVEAVLQGESIEFEAEIPFPHVGLRFLRLAYVPDRNERDEVVGWFGSITDITKSKLADEALRASEERFRQFMNNLPGAAWIKDWEGRYVYASDEACRIFGRSRPGLYGKKDEEIFPKETAAQFRENDRLAMDSGTAIQTTEALLQNDGVHHSIVTKFPVRGHDGKPVFVGGIAVDVTEQKRAEEALRRSEELALLASARLAAIVESSSDAIVSLDLDGIITSWNAGAERILGYKADEVVGRPIFDFVPRDLHREESKILERLRDGERVAPFDTIRITKWGRQVDLSLSMSPVRDSSGKIVGVSKIGRDITERKLADNALRESERQFRHLVLSLPVAMYTTDREGRITLFNEPAARLWGRRPEIRGDLYCGPWRIFNREGNPLEHEECPMAVALREDRSIRDEEIVIEREDETRSYVLTHVEPLRDGTGRLTGAINMLVDITDRKEVERAVQRARDELEVRVRERTADLVKVNEDLRKRDLQLSTAQQIAGLGSWEWDLQSGDVTWSEELYRIHGIAHGGFGGTIETFLEFSHPEDRSLMRTHLQESINTRKSFDFEGRIIRPDGRLRILHSQGRVETAADGRVTKLLGVCMDVTERRRAQEKFRGLLESAPDAMIIAEQDGRIVLVNAQTERLFGYTRTELLGQQVEILLPERFRQARNYFLSPSDPQMDHGLELFGLRKDNTEFPVEVSISPLETEEGLLVASAIRDMTQQRKLRSSLLATERQRSADLRRYTLSVQRAQEEERQRIARELHDDLCQRLSGMMLNVEVIADEVRAKDKPLYRRLKNVNKQCDEMIVGVRRMSANLRPIVLDDFGLVTALRLLAREFEALHKIPIRFEVEENARQDLDPQLEIALYRIAQEGLSNISKHAQSTRGTMTLQKDNETVRFSISDNGKGLSPDSLSRKDALHGLGLIGMRERASMLGGSFSIESTRKGTTVTVTIPLNVEVKHEEDAPSYS